MKAIRLYEYGGPERLTYEEAPTPEPAAGEVRIRVKAAGLNPADWKIREGFFKQRLDYAMPTILGCEVAGDIDALGPDVTGFAVGDAVYAMIDLSRNGGYAEYIVVPATLVAPKPASLDYQQAASVPVVALTAYQVLHDVASVQPGQRVLIHGGGGGVGAFAVQFAKQAGAEVIATASAGDADYVRGLGADQVLDYRTQAFEELVSEVDVVLDTVGGAVQERSWGVLRPGGTLVSVVQPPSPEAAARVNATGVMTSVQPNGQRLREFGALFDGGQLHVLVGQRFPLSETQQAHVAMQQGQSVRGKRVLQIA